MKQQGLNVARMAAVTVLATLLPLSLAISAPVTLSVAPYVPVPKLQAPVPAIDAPSAGASKPEAAGTSTIAAAPESLLTPLPRLEAVAALPSQQSTSVATVNAGPEVPQSSSSDVRFEAKATTAPATPSLPAFTVIAGDDVVDALDAWLKSIGWKLDWQAQGSTAGRLRHFVAEGDWTTSPASVGGLLRSMLKGLGVSASVLDAAKRVIVRNESNLTD